MADAASESSSELQLVRNEVHHRGHSLAILPPVRHHKGPKGPPMKRLRILLAIVLAATMSVASSPVGATPEVATTLESTTSPERVVDFVPASTTTAICTYRRNSLGLNNYWIAVTTFHYGTAHVTQCWFRSGNPWGWGVYSYCWQYVWNIPSPSWNLYDQGFWPDGRCW
jgi:hypothetical protein